MDRVILLCQKHNSQSLKLIELESVIIKRNKKSLALKEELKSYRLLVKSLKNNKKEILLIRQYENLLRDYRLEISDLKDEIEDWKIRYIKK